MAAASCYLLPVMLMMASGSFDKDRYKRSLSGVKLHERAIQDFIAWLTRVGVLPEPKEIPSTAEIGYACDCLDALSLAFRRPQHARRRTRSNLPAVSMLVEQWCCA